MSLITYALLLFLFAFSVGWLAIPLIRRAGYDYAPYNRDSDRATIAVSAGMTWVALSVVFGFTGYFATASAWGFAVGIIGATLFIAGMVGFATYTEVEEPSAS